MKYLKLYEALYSLSDSNEYYSKISEQEYRNMKVEIPEYGANINKTVIIPDKDYFRIEAIFDKVEKDMNLSSSDIRMWTRPYTLDFIDEINVEIHGSLSIRCGRYIQIHLIDDEWYIVEIDADNSPDLYYKCDQVEGLEKFLIELFNEEVPTKKQIDDFKKFNESSESKMIDYEDYIFSFIEKDPLFQDIGENWIYLEYDNFTMDLYLDIKTYFDGVRFKDNRIFTEYEYGDLYILIIDEDFYESNIKIDELNWEDHPMVEELRKTNIDLSAFGNMQYAKMVKGLPNNCTLIKGLNFSGGIEFWPQQVISDPIYVKNLIGLQYLLYKYTI